MRPFCLRFACRLLVLAILLGPFLLAGVTVLLSAQARGDTSASLACAGTTCAASMTGPSFAWRVN
ncbi:hypothetical protein H2509_19785 [Stappia sp. F7233]|uniref:Uncharacterized protein n=1 Tax=Stappia albiluteola TaxID=2758565 RepID=A0A839AKQ0_9HYPH|nr:hypothetical protein [Stappia albiluteola]MBA5779377.1 hypothetical protein [Stappia albiluteola]